MTDTMISVAFDHRKAGSACALPFGIHYFYPFSGLIVLCRRLDVCVFVCMFNVLGTNWGPTDRVLFMQIQSFKILLLREKQFLREPPYALGSFLDKKSATVQPC